jgi:hypothetical protein
VLDENEQINIADLAFVEGIFGDYWIPIEREREEKLKGMGHRLANCSQTRMADAPREREREGLNTKFRGLMRYPQITYYWTGLLMLDHSYLVGNLTNSKNAETKTVEPLKS